MQNSATPQRQTTLFRNSKRSVLLASAAFALGLAGCASFVGLATYHYKGGAVISNSNVAVVDSGAGSHMVVFAETPTRLFTRDDDTGSGMGSGAINLDFSIKAMAPGSTRTIYALTTTNKVKSVTFASDGRYQTQSAGFSVAAGEDIAASADGSSIYIAEDNRLARYASNGAFLGSVALPRTNGYQAYGGARRVAVDATSGSVYSAEAFSAIWGSNLQPVIRVTRYTASLGSPQISDHAVYDSRNEIHDFDVSDGHIVIERKGGFGASVLDYRYASNSQDTIIVNNPSWSAAGSLSSSGMRSNFAPCGGNKGAYLWRARTNWPYYMLQRHTLCED